MLLYTHPINEARSRGGQLPVNSFWLSGSGALPPASARASPELRVTHDLRDAALRQDWAAWVRLAGRSTSAMRAGCSRRRRTGSRWPSPCAASGRRAPGAAPRGGWRRLAAGLLAPARRRAGWREL